MFFYKRKIYSKNFNTRCVEQNQHQQYNENTIEIVSLVVTMKKNEQFRHCNKKTTRCLQRLHDLLPPTT